VIEDRAWERIEKLRLEEEIDSDHQSVTVWVDETERRGRREVETESEKEEVKEILRRVKERKMMEVDGIPGEAWTYGGDEIEDWVWHMCNRIWRGEGWPEEWKKGIVIPVMKKKQRRLVGNYRGVTVMPILYTIYARALAEKLKEEVEGRVMLSPSQTGFRKEMGTLDNIFVLNFLSY